MLRVGGIGPCVQGDFALCGGCPESLDGQGGRAQDASVSRQLRFTHCVNSPQ